MTIKPPFPWFGGKSQVAHVVWERFGNVPNYVEPFFGSGAVLFARPTTPKTETINDKDGYVANFWRAVQKDPEQVAYYADWPVNEIDLAARRDWIFSKQAELYDRMWRDPDYYDPEIAGWWVWGVSATIGNAWQPKSTHLGGAGMGVHRPRTHLGAGRGVHRPGTHLGDAGRGDRLIFYMLQLSERLKSTRIMSGEWDRVISPTVTTHNGVTGMFLDPPYGADNQTGSDAYCVGDKDVSNTVCEWCIENGDNPLMRIALCGYEGEHNMPSSWDCVAWKARGGYGSQSDQAGRDNCHRERIWFSPHCINNELFVAC